MDSDCYEVRVTTFFGKHGDDFELWAIRIMTVLEGKEHANVVRGEEKAPADGNSAQYAAYVLKCRKARALILMALGDSPLRVIQFAAGKEDMWRKFYERHAAKTTASKIIVLTSLMNKRHDPSKDMGKYLSQLESLFKQASRHALALEYHTTDGNSTCFLNGRR